mgnify:CR=1 FL=1
MQCPSEERQHGNPDAMTHLLAVVMVVDNIDGPPLPGAWFTPVAAAGFVAVGAVHRIVDPDDLMETATEIAQKAAVLAPMSVAAMKEIVREAPDQARIEELVRSCAFSADVVEGLSAMREKRSPVFNGK